MKSLKYTILFLFFGGLIQAQSDLGYTHFVFNKMAYNPGYTGSAGGLDMTALYRSQWMGIDGAPETATFNIQLPFVAKRSAFGVGITSDKIGKVGNLDLDFSYAYVIPFSKNNRLSLGINAKVEQSKIDWDLANPVEGGDDGIPTGQEVSYNPNFGFGAYYSGANYYLGISAPRLLKNALYLENNPDISALEVSTFYVMGGWLMPIGEVVEFAPSAMLSYNPNAPADLDLNANFFFMKSFLLGLGYRFGDSIDGLIGYEFKNGLRFGVAFDNTLSDLEKLTQGSWEVMLGYTFRCEDCEIPHLRFF